MTLTNRAFIKAYRTDEPQTAPTGPVLSKVAAPASPEAKPLLRQAASATGGATQPSAVHESYADATQTLARRVDTRTEEPAVEPRVTAEPFRARSTATTIKPPLANRPATTGDKRPLSSFIASAGIARLDNEPAEGDFFRPGTTVASFHWPEVTRTLSRHCGAQLDRVADLLIAHAEVGRSLTGILGMTRGQGASTVTLCLAARLAQKGRRVIVLDANFRHPCLAQWLESEPTSGWQDVLKHGAPLTDAVVRAVEDRIDLVGLGDKVPSDLQKLASGLQAVVTAGVLRHAYENVLIDLGAFRDSSATPIAFELAKNMGVDVALAVTGATSRAEDVTTIGEQFGNQGCEFLGAVENRVLS